MPDFLLIIVGASLAWLALAWFFGRFLVLKGFFPKFKKWVNSISVERYFLINKILTYPPIIVGGSALVVWVIWRIVISYQ